jgi:hypothetical protein
MQILLRDRYPGGDIASVDAGGSQLLNDQVDALAANVLTGEAIGQWLQPGKPFQIVAFKNNRADRKADFLHRQRGNHDSLLRLQKYVLLGLPPLPVLRFLAGAPVLLFDIGPVMIRRSHSIRASCQ